MLSGVQTNQSYGKVIFHIIGLTKCSKSSRPNQPVFYRAYVEDELLCSFKFIYAYLAWRSAVVTQDLTDFFITFGKPQYPASKDSLAWWVKEVMGKSGIDTETFRSHSIMVASKSAAYNLVMSLLEVLKKGQWSNACTFFTHYFDSIDLYKSNGNIYDRNKSITFN